MKKFYLPLLLLVIMILLSGCVEKNIPQESQDNINQKQEALDDKIKEFGDGELSPEQINELNLLEADLSTEREGQGNEIVEELIKLDDQKKSGEAVRGSCNAIGESSTCLEYIGSIWTEEHMRLNCSDSGSFSLEPCPENMAGGCNIGAGLSNDMISWFYLNGGGGIDADGLKYAKMACDANPLSTWIVK